MSRLPPFQKFQVHSDEQSVDTRWTKWLDTFDKLIRALDIVVTLCFRGSLQRHFHTKKVNMINTTRWKFLLQRISHRRRLWPTDALESSSPLSVKVRRMTHFYTRLCTLSGSCEFHDVDREILNEIIHACLSTRLRRRALRYNKYSFSKTYLQNPVRLKHLERRAMELQIKFHACSVSSLSRGSIRSGGSFSRGSTHYKGSSISRGSAHFSTSAFSREPTRSEVVASLDTFSEYAYPLRTRSNILFVITNRALSHHVIVSLSSALVTRLQKGMSSSEMSPSELPLMPTWPGITAGTRSLPLKRWHAGRCELS